VERDNGFSLIELVIAMTVGSVVLVALCSLLVAVTMATVRTGERLDAQASAVVAGGVVTRTASCDVAAIQTALAARLPGATATVMVEAQAGGCTVSGTVGPSAAVSAPFAAQVTASP
jgi:prepilin-type N-terminal cleavage/methylation domain-containing protein